MTSSNDGQKDRKADAASADDEAAFEVTPFGRRRRPGKRRATLNWFVRFLCFPFFHVYRQFRRRKPSAAQKWADESGRHGAPPSA
ncbi:MAG TPA: hypothetical protein VIM11_23260 [Tepidisphaeraceae bacterium]|jgi:hypothetical protein